MNEKNTGQQERKLSGKRSLIIIIAVCIIAAAGILFAAMLPPEAPVEVAETEKTEIKDVQNIESPTLEETIKEEAELNIIGEEEVPSSETNSIIEQAIKDEKKISALKPLEGDITASFEIDKLIFNSTLNIWQTHCGVDITPGDQAEVKAAIAGEVISVEKDPTMGIYVTMLHADNIVTKYAGLEDCSLEAGAKLQKGDVIGICGTPPFEADMGQHLHFEVWDGTSPIDPEKIFEK